MPNPANQAAAAQAVPADDTRTSKEVMRQYDRIRLIKGQLVKRGYLSDDATPGEVLAEVRRQIPADLF